MEEAVPFAFARGLGVEVPEEGDVLEHVAARMGRERRLVVVDNCEHLLDASGDVIEQLIGSCPSVHVLATSREPVMVRGERLSAVPSLTPDDALSVWSGPQPKPRTWNSIQHRAKRRWSCVNVWIGCHWRSNWLHPDYEPRRRLSCWQGSMSGCGCWWVVVVRGWNGIRRCAAPSIGPTTCVTRLSRRCSIACRCSPPASTSTTLLRSHRLTGEGR